MERLVTLTTVRLEHEAHLIKACLEAANIPCMITGNSAASVIGAHNLHTTTWSHPLGGIHIKVREQDLTAAQEVLDASANEYDSEYDDETPPLRQPWYGLIVQGLSWVPLPLRIVLILLGGLYFCGTIAAILFGIFASR